MAFVALLTATLASSLFPIFAGLLALVAARRGVARGWLRGVARILFKPPLQLRNELREPPHFPDQSRGLGVTPGDFHDELGDLSVELDDFSVPISQRSLQLGEGLTCVGHTS